MSFHSSACDVHLTSEPQGATSLVAICNNEEGSGRLSALVLDELLGNKDGHFTWNGRNFTESARNIELRRAGPARMPVLHADLKNGAGQYVSDETDLTEHVRNIDGQLVRRDIWD